MEHLLLAVIGILVIVILVLSIKLHLMHRVALEIEEAFAHRLATDTNTLIDISSRDPYMRKLAASINQQLRLLRRQRHQYLHGDQELKESVTNISHDLRTPLTAICGYLDLLEGEEKSENVTRYLSYIQERTQALKALTEELFRYSVITSTAEDLALKPVSVKAVLEESIAGFYDAFTQRGITPVIRLPEVPVIRTLNREALVRIFSNLLNNALKYSDGDLEIILSDQGEIIFTNTAAGLDEIQVGKLFDRFFTVEAARNSTGLGLSIAKILAERMNGSITARYQDNKLSIHVYFL